MNIRDVQEQAKRELEDAHFRRRVEMEKKRLLSKQTFKGFIDNLIPFTLISKLTIDGYREIIKHQRDKIKELTFDKEPLQQRILTLQEENFKLKHGEEVLSLTEQQIIDDMKKLNPKGWD